MTNLSNISRKLYLSSCLSVAVALMEEEGVVGGEDSRFALHLGDSVIISSFGPECPFAASIHVTQIVLSHYPCNQSRRPCNVKIDKLQVQDSLVSFVAASLCRFGVSIW